jgi:hypothetical protein
MRLFRYLSFSNVIAVLALFIALGGAAYAGTKINGKTIVNKSIGGGKLKNETITANKIKKGTITSAQITPGSIDSTQININTLTTVPSATTATTATTAKTAETATKADSATSAVTAGTADTATVADNAKHAEEADQAKHASEADNAKHASEADLTTLAGEAEKLGGKTAANLTVTCPAATEFYGGMCWDETNRPVKFWIAAAKQCGELGGRLPTVSELVAFVLQPGTQVGEEVWSGDVVGVTGTEEKVLTSTEGVRGEREAAEASLGYRCVFPKAN